MIVPCHNDGLFAAAAVASLIAQTHAGFECVIVDDGSQPGDMDPVREVIAGDSRFQIVRHETNRGLPAARNTGLASTTGWSVAFLDSDDLLTRRSLETRLAALTDTPVDVSGSYTGVRFAGEETTLDSLPSAYRTGPESPVDFVSADGECPFPVHAPLTKRSVLEHVGGFDETLSHGTEDWDLWLRILRLGLIFVPDGVTTAIYRQRSNAMTRRDARHHVRGAEALLDRAESVDSESAVFPGVIPAPRPLHQYRRDIKLLERALRFALMARVSGEPAEADAILDHVSTDNWPLLLRHIDTRRLAEGVVLRTGMNTHVEEAQDKVRSDLTEIISQLTSRGR